MPRRGEVTRREILPDPRYNNVLVTMLVNTIMQHGKKGVAFKIVYGAFDQIAQDFKERFAESMLEKENRSLPADENLLKEKDDAPHTEDTYEGMPLKVFLKALENIMPIVEVRAQRVGGGVHQVPKTLTDNRKKHLGFRSLKKAAIARKKTLTFKPGVKAMVKALALELMDAYDNKGGAVKMRAEMHRMAKANQAYVHVRFSSMQELQ